MSTRVDKNVLLTLLPVETVSGMSTRVDDSQDDITVIIETVSGMSTRVDQQIQSLKLNG